ncbi:DUF418 domain-containing protein [Paenibacillus sp. MER TA 81-3]|uniref:DUF418 domain-containing protein n=1 Tax=Paenibacillus sp. MER TA 81-3 TaxID=2939573 RepID=UPI00203DEDD7|nr:DUF418 domain-containing protein [Paenibacillus sp. MER TA 81-3]MCM3341663.1 DUF418 domain-containing protein [Paenibacillus sp. MER TA 81-3]
MNRIQLLDILRGFAIIGTLGTNIWLFAHLGNLEAIFPDPSLHWWSSLDSIISTIVMFLVNGKFLGMLTIMFGVGLEMKRRKAERLGTAWPGIYLWTSFLLLVDGLLHYFLVMQFDILMSYAVTAIIVSFVVNRTRKTIIRVMLFTGIVHSFMVISAFSLITLANASVSTGDAFKSVIALFQTGTWFEQIGYRFETFWMYRFESIAILPMNVFLFLCGVLLFRSGAFAADTNGQAIRRKMLGWGLGLGIPLNMLIFVPGLSFDIPVRYLFAPVLSLGYIAIIAKVMELSRCGWLLSSLEEVGKTALSCYMLQNILASVIFYGWGFGVGATSGSSLFTFFIWGLISALMMVSAHLWLRKFTVGPMEWAWRRLSDLPADRKRSLTG